MTSSDLALCVASRTYASTVLFSFSFSFEPDAIVALFSSVFSSGSAFSSATASFESLSPKSPDGSPPDESELLPEFSPLSTDGR